MPPKKRKTQAQIDAQERAEKREMDRLLRHRIIEEIELFPIIYDKQHPEHFRTDKKNQIYDDIGVRLGEAGDDIATKWKSLVDAFRTRDRSGAAGETIEEKTEKWEFYSKMMFIKPYIESRRYIFITYVEYKHVINMIIMIP